MLKIIEILEIIIIILIGVAYITLAERKVLGAMQRRKGPNIVGMYGILQPIADGVKLAIKEIIIPQQSNKLFFKLGNKNSFYIYFKNENFNVKKINIKY